MDTKLYSKDDIISFYFAGYKIAHSSWGLNQFVVYSKKGIINNSSLSDNSLLDFMEQHIDNWYILDKNSIILN
jgi:hypothetical protein